MMLARKWDHIENRVSQGLYAGTGHPPTAGETLDASPYDIFAHIALDTRSEGLIDDVRDLRRYLLLVEAEMLAQGVVHGAHRDNV